MRIALISQRLKTHQLLRAAAQAERDEVCWTCAEVASAIERFRDDPPDLLLLEVGAIEGGAARAARRFVKSFPCPVLLLARAGEAGSDEVARSFEAGAMDIALLPDEPGTSSDAAVRVLGAKLRTMRRLSLVPLDATGAQSPAASRALIAIGGSTGGPQALGTVLTQLPKPCPVPVLAVIHIDKVFVRDLVSWLTLTTGMRARIAASGERPQAGEVRLASSDDHLVLGSSGLLDYTADPIGAPYRPSVDVFFESLARHCDAPGVAVLLTGMGRDGAAGLLRLRERGWSTIAQDEATSAVYGMPKAAAELGAADEILALDRIGAAIHACLDPARAGSGGRQRRRASER